MKYLLLALLVLAGCSDDKAEQLKRQQEYDAGTKFGVSMIGKCLREWTGENYNLERYQPEGWVKLCWVGKVCDFKDPKQCITNKVCSSYAHGLHIQEQIAKKIYTVIDCKEIE